MVHNCFHSSVELVLIKRSVDFVSQKTKRDNGKSIKGKSGSWNGNENETTAQKRAVFQMARDIFEWMACS
jgi:hypothetical protein